MQKAESVQERQQTLPAKQFSNTPHLAGQSCAQHEVALHKYTLAPGQACQAAQQAYDCQAALKMKHQAETSIKRTNKPQQAARRSRCQWSCILPAQDVQPEGDVLQ